MKKSVKSITGRKVGITAIRLMVVASAERIKYWVDKNIT